MSVDGTYNYEANTPLGKQKGKFTFKTEGKTLTGTGVSIMGTDNITAGVVEGNKLTFKINTKGPVGPMTLDFTLTLNGDKLSGQAIMQPSGYKSKVEGVRVPT